MIKPAIFFAPVIALMIGGAVLSYKIGTTIEHKTITVVSKERLMSVSNSDGKTSTNFKNYVYSDDEAYIVDDNIWQWHFTSSTVYAKIQPGKCDVTLSGWRIGWASKFQNIIEAECQKQ